MERKYYSIKQIMLIDPAVRSIMLAAYRSRRLPDKAKTYERLKVRLSRYVGFYARDERLQTCDAYETALRGLTHYLEY